MLFEFLNSPLTFYALVFFFRLKLLQIEEPLIQRKEKELETLDDILFYVKSKVFFLIRILDDSCEGTMHIIFSSKLKGKERRHEVAA